MLGSGGAVRSAVVVATGLALVSACLPSASGEVSQPEVRGTLSRDAFPLEGVAVQCRGRTGQTSARTNAKGEFVCEHVITHLIVFGDTGCNVNVRFSLPGGVTSTFQAGHGARPCAPNARVALDCKITNSPSKGVTCEETTSP